MRSATQTERERSVEMWPLPPHQQTVQVTPLAFPLRAPNRQIEFVQSHRASTLIERLASRKPEEGFDLSSGWGHTHRHVVAQDEL
jgi:hypothetical protein